MKNDIQLREGIIKLEDEDGNEICRFSCWTYGIKKYYGLKMIDVINEWSGKTTEYNILSLQTYMIKHYPKVSVFSDRDVMILREYKKFMRKKHGNTIQKSSN